MIIPIFLSNYTGKKLEQLVFSNGKTQEDVVKEILEVEKPTAFPN